jgi:hypothetical protein
MIIYFSGICFEELNHKKKFKAVNVLVLIRIQQLPNMTQDRDRCVNLLNLSFSLKSID